MSNGRFTRAARKGASTLLIALACLCIASSRGSWLDTIKDPVKMKKYLESWVIAPTYLEGMKEDMERSGFTCSIRKDSTFKKHMRYLYCSREVQKPEHALWEIAFEIAKYRGMDALNGEVAVIKTYPRNR